nr:phage portal protein [Acetobacter fallax]
MMFPSTFPRRTRNLLALERVLDGTLYDHIPYPFFKSCDTDGTYIPINRRRPSIRSHLCSTVVDDSASLLFSQSHWPTVVAKTEDGADDNEREHLIRNIISDLNLASVMEQAAVMGSVGSVAILVQAVDDDLVVEIKKTCFLEPTFSLFDSRRLIRVRERYVVDSDGLERAGFGEYPPGNYWFTRDFTENETVWYQPVKLESGQHTWDTLVKDEARSVEHGLGIVPIVWIKNLPGNDPGSPDGKCTFAAGIDAMIDADYLLSQTVRGLRYSADPTMVLSTDEYQLPGMMSPQMPKDASHAISLPQGGDAKLLEINGTGAAASLNMWEALRALALEAMHGNRAHGDRVTAAQSGRAMELMCLGLTWLTGRLRRSYGEYGLVSVLNLICRISQIVPDLNVAGKFYGPVRSGNISLVWPPWFEPTFGDMQTMANAVQAARSANAISIDTAIRMMRPATHVQHVGEEKNKITDDIKAHDERLKALDGQVQDRDPTEV